MDPEKQREIEKQLQEISELSIPVTIVINETVTLTDCRLIYKTDNGKELFIRVLSGECPETGDVKFSCVSPTLSCTFRSSIVSRKEMDSQSYMHFKIRFPDGITEKERRQYFRVRPSATNPIQIRLAIPGSDTVGVEAMDIGGGGVSFAVQTNLNEFAVGDQLYLDINLPTFSWLSALVTVRNITVLQNMARIGVEFSRVSEDARKIIMEYVTSKIREK